MRRVVGVYPRLVKVSASLFPARIVYRAGVRPSAPPGPVTLAPGGRVTSWMLTARPARPAPAGAEVDAGAGTGASPPSPGRTAARVDSRPLAARAACCQLGGGAATAAAALAGAGAPAAGAAAGA